MIEFLRMLWGSTFDFNFIMWVRRHWDSNHEGLKTKEACDAYVDRVFLPFVKKLVRLFLQNIEKSTNVSLRTDLIFVRFVGVYLVLEFNPTTREIENNQITQMIDPFCLSTHQLIITTNLNFWTWPYGMAEAKRQDREKDTWKFWEDIWFIPRCVMCSPNVYVFTLWLLNVMSWRGYVRRLISHVGVKYPKSLPERTSRMPQKLDLFFGYSRQTSCKVFVLHNAALVPVLVRQLAGGCGHNGELWWSDWPASRSKTCETRNRSRKASLQVVDRGSIEWVGWRAFVYLAI